MDAGNSTCAKRLLVYPSCSLLSLHLNGSTWYVNKSEENSKCTTAANYTATLRCQNICMRRANIGSTGRTDLLTVHLTCMQMNSRVGMCACGTHQVVRVCRQQLPRSNAAQVHGMQQ